MPNGELLQSLLIVVGFLVGVFLLSNFLKKNLAQKKIHSLGVNFKIVSRLPLSNKVSLYIIQIGNHYILIGVSDQNVTAIADLTKVMQSSSQRSQSSNFETSSIQSDELGEPHLSFKNFLKETFKRSKN
jgi:flagellar biogenesis protein FliO